MANADPSGFAVGDVIVTTEEIRETGGTWTVPVGWRGCIREPLGDGFFHVTGIDEGDKWYKRATFRIGAGQMTHSLELDEDVFADPEPTNPTYYDALVKRNKIMERGVLARHAEDVSDADIYVYTHAHVTVRSGLVHMTFWNTDPITKNKVFGRIAINYDHFLLAARGLVDGHDERKSLDLHAAEGGE